VRLVLDTNVFVSFALNAASLVARVVDAVMARHTPLHSPEMIAEVIETLGKPKLARYIRRDNIDDLIRAYVSIGQPIDVDHPIRACRDPDDDKFLSVAVAGVADAIVTGDDDLLVLHPFRGIEILRPAAIAGRL
jgi:uncharacterized protein